VRGSYNGRTIGVFVEVVMAELLDSVGRATMTRIRKAQFWVSAMLTLVVKPWWARYKLDETIERPCSDFLVHTSKVCKSAHLYNEYSAIQDDHDSWGMRTTSAKCKTVITVVLTVMSGMDPHMISGP
jgi:hypothetical protein